MWLLTSGVAGEVAALLVVFENAEFDSDDAGREVGDTARTCAAAAVGVEADELGKL